MADISIKRAHHGSLSDARKMADKVAVIKSADPLKPLSELKRGRLGEEILKIVKANIAD